jgi:hypothetical protein
MLILASALALGSSQVEARLGAGIRVIESDESGITLEVRVDTFDVSPLSQQGREFHLVQFRDFLTTQEEGLPQLPYTSALVGIPFDKTARLRVLQNETASVAGLVPSPTPRSYFRDGEVPTPAVEFAINEDFYSGRTVFPADAARLGEPATLRHQRVVSVFLFPFRYDAGAHEIIYSKTLVVRVDFVDAGAGSGDGGGTQQGLSTEPAPSFELNAEGLYQGLLINYERAKYWRRKPVSNLTGTPFPVSQAAGEYKIGVDSSGVYRVAYSDVPGLGSSYPVSQVRLFEKFYLPGDPMPFKQRDVPIDLVDANANGYFDGPDYLIFYGLSFRDRFPTDVMEQRYSYENVYWLTVGGLNGLAMELRNSWRTGVSPQQLQSFLHVEKFERDSLFLDFVSRGDIDYYLWTTDVPPYYEIALPFFIYAPDTTKAWRMRARYQGSMPVLHYITMLLDNSRGQTDTLFNRASFGPSYPNAKAEVILDTGFSIQDTMLASGASTMRYRGERNVLGNLVPGSGSYLDWFEVSYYKRFLASQGKLAFNSSGLTGELEFTLSGFPSPDIALYEVTDSLNPVHRSVDASQITLQGSTYQLVFRDSLGLAPRRYEAVVGSSAARVPTVTLDSPSSLSTSGAGKDYFIVTNEEFVPALEPLVSHRRTQGHSVEVARLSDVFDEFNGGRRSPTAILRYMQYGFVNWGTPLFLLLVGDASKDYKDVLPSSSPDFVPTYLIVSPVSTPNGRELVGSDHWYVSGLDGVEDDYPDMYVGRIPAGSTTELSSVVQKMLAYETFSPQETFRGTGIFFSDDSYSGAEWVTECYKWSERIFRTISLAARDIVVHSPASPGFQADTLFLSAYLDTVPSLPKDSCVNLAEMQQYTRQNVTPELVSRLSQGSLFVNFQGHANRNLTTHEYVFVDNMRVYGMADVGSLNNYSRPAFWTAFSCHFNDYEEENEDDGMVGDCLGEKLLFLPGRGAIAVFASNAFELLPLSVNGDMNVAMFDAFFGSPPTSDLRGKRGARWLLGELLASTQVRYLAGDYSNKFTVKTYTLLGDPALRMDALPPQIAVSVDGSAVSTGSRIYSVSEDDSVRVQALMNDEVAVDGSSIWMEETGPDGTGTIPSSSYQVSTTADTVLGASRRFSLYYPATLRPGTYDVELHARDVNGRESSFSLRVVLDASFFDAAGRPIRDGSFVASRLGVRAAISSPIILSQGDIRFLVDGGDSTASAVVEQIGSSGRDWRVDISLGLTDGEHVLSVAVGGVQRSVTVAVSSGFAMRGVFVYPSPFEGVTSFNYELTGSPAKVVIEIFSISGRKISEFSGGTGVGQNSVIWEGVDAEGDRVANGLYVYRITATDIEGNKISKLDKVVKVE